MDYLQIYKEEFKRTFEEIKSQTIDEFKIAKTDHGNFNTFFTKLINKLYEEEMEITKYFFKSKYKTCFNLVKNRKELFDQKLKEDEVISLIFDQIIEKEFTELGLKNNEQFIKKIARYKCIEEVGKHFNSHNAYYELIYGQERYDYFYAVDFENNDYESSKEYIEMLELEHPGSTKIKYPEINNEQKASNPMLSQEKVDTDITTKERLSNEFDTKERAILIYLFKNRLDLKSIDTTVLIKLILIIGSTSKFEIFEVTNASDSYLYKQVIKGYTVFKRSEQKNKIAFLKVKLENNGLKFIAEELQIDYSQYFNPKK
jgi:hypothetical protein